jgi:hypothetical protein
MHIVEGEVPKVTFADSTISSSEEMPCTKSFEFTHQERVWDLAKRALRAAAYPSTV